MKKIFYTTLTLLILSLSNINAQSNEDYSFYVGTWKYTNTTTGEEFTIRLRDTTVIDSFDYTSKTLVGIYIYI